MNTIKLQQTTSATAKPIRGGGYFLPVNVTTGGCACTLNTRYDGMQLPEDILTLAHYPKTVVLREYYI